MDGEILKIYYSGSMCEAHPSCFQERTMSKQMLAIESIVMLLHYIRG